MELLTTMVKLKCTQLASRSRPYFVPSVRRHVAVYIQNNFAKQSCGKENIKISGYCFCCRDAVWMFRSLVPFAKWLRNRDRLVHMLRHPVKRALAVRQFCRTEKPNSKARKIMEVGNFETPYVDRKIDCSNKWAGNCTHALTEAYDSPLIPYSSHFR